MGNGSSVRGERDSGASDEDEGCGPPPDLVGQSPPPSPGGPLLSPLFFAPQAPISPLLHENDAASCISQEPMIWSAELDMIAGHAIPTLISWSSGGHEVAVVGSWDDWQTQEPLQRWGEDFSIMKVLPCGVYHYKFVVDGEQRCSTELPRVCDEMGYECNVLDILEGDSEDIENSAAFEPPSSPESSYNSWPLGSEDFSKAPPLVPPHLLVTLLNNQSFVDSSSQRPLRVVLNHLYIHKNKDDLPLVALGVTHRFLSKYVSVVVYKPARQ
ncbi:SNF1-related protein kinase regulatory subunit beta-2-like isoform X2 [Wolffia australiana]